MKLNKVTSAIILIAFSLLGSACKSSFVVSHVDYSQPIESVLQPDAEGLVHDIRYGISFNVLPFQYQELEDSSSVIIDEIRLIRNTEGYYFITARQFNHVYVMEPGQGELKMKKKIKVAENGLLSPAFNMRGAVVELVELESHQTFALSAEGIQEQERREQS